jgi:hypothetical protein
LLRYFQQIGKQKPTPFFSKADAGGDAKSVGLNLTYIDFCLLSVVIELPAKACRRVRILNLEQRIVYHKSLCLSSPRVFWEPLVLPNNDSDNTTF